ncbi:MAG: Planctomycete cytochrome [Bryobacterales bacterium]|nr:Planctomycete cytochrome [Bryobacterales bacterium]
MEKLLPQIAFVGIVLTAPVLIAAEPTQQQIEFFEKKVRPILVNNCYACHSADTKPAGGLRLDDRNGILHGGQSGPAVVPGAPEKSLLLTRVRHEDPKRRMPKEGDPLSASQIADLTAWIQDGAAWPVEKVSTPASTAAQSYERIKARHWALQPLTDPKVPEVSRKTWPLSEVDRFILAKLEERKLAPLSDAAPLTLIRRVTYDLTGLPPTPAEIEAFLKDESGSAYARLVDRLLASPRFGERWGRHWLDVARYGESSGPSRNIPYPHAWRYRDYVINAVNRDVSYDRFIQEQVAGDLLPAATIPERDRLLIATGFLALGPKDVNQRFEERFIMDDAAEQIDTLTRSTLALTVGCARCHDHKFDPIPTADYYALAGIFTSTDDAVGVRSKMGGAGLDYYDPKMMVRLASYTPPAPTEASKELEAEIAAAKKQFDAIRDTREGLAVGPDGRPRQQEFRVKWQRLQAQLLDLTDPGARGYAVHGLREGKHPADTAVRIRGEAERLGPVAPRGFLTSITVPGAPKIDPAHSGRLELAQWLTNPQNPLTARVIVNRVWQHLFGQGIVTTVDNFGITGDQPSHPELLDYLASRFVQDGWSIKKLVRTLVLSRTYRLGSEAPAAYREIDPANRLLWRHSPRRLDAEEIRDSMLASAGRLQLQPPVGSPARDLKMVEMRDNGPDSRNIQEAADRSQVRSIYLPLLRGVTPSALAAFDPVTQTLVTGQRESTTVPTQALFLLNSTFVRRQSLSLAEQLLSQTRLNDAARIRQAYRLTLGRAPNRLEIERARKFVVEYGASYRRLPASEVQPPVAARPAVAPPRAGFGDADDMDRTEYVAIEETVQPENPQAAAWLSFVQALYASADFRFVR